MASPTQPQPEISTPPQNEAPKPISPDIAQRRDRVAKRLDPENFNRQFSEPEFKTLKSGWSEDLNTDLDPAIKRAIANGNKEAIVMQNIPGVPDGTDAEFMNVYLGTFGAIAKAGGEEIPLQLGNIKDVLNNPNVPRIQIGELSNSQGTVIVVDQEGRPTDLVVDTEIPGVRIQMDGNWTSVEGRVEAIGSIRPFLRVKVEDDTQKTTGESVNNQPQAKAEEEVPAEEVGEDMSPEDRISQTASSLQRAREEESRLIKEDASPEDINKASRQVKELEGILKTDQQEARIMRLESTVQNLIEINGQLNETVKKLIENQKELIEASNMDEKKKKNLLAQLALLLAGAAISAVKDSGVVGLPQAK